MSGAGLFSPRAPLSDSIPNPGTGTDNVVRKALFCVIRKSLIINKN